MESFDSNTKYFISNNKLEEFGWGLLAFMFAPLLEYNFEIPEEIKNKMKEMINEDGTMNRDEINKFLKEYNYE